MEKCFALNEYGQCTALKEKNCNKCRFFRTDIIKNDIEMEIIRYSPEGKKNDF